MEEDVTTRTITVLVVLTVLISVLGTFSVWTAIQQAEFKTNAQEKPVAQASNGQVSLTIAAPEEKGAAGATGMVSLAIIV